MRGQTTIEYVLVAVIVALVIFTALKMSGIDNGVRDSGNMIGNRMSSAMDKVNPKP